MNKNRDYTFQLREVPPSAQEKINLLFEALRTLFSEQYGGGITSKFSPSPEPAPEQWIVEYYNGGFGWSRSGNDLTRGIFDSLLDAEAALVKETDGFEYRAVPLKD